MSSRQVRWIFVVLALLVAVLVARGFLMEGLRNQPRTGGGDIVAAIADGLSLVRALGPGEGDTVRLELSGATWTVNGYPADTALVRQMAEGLDTALVGRLVARSAANHGRLGITPDSARRVEIGPANDPDLVFLLGRGGTDGRFIRFPPSDEVFTVSAMSMRLFGRSEEEWRNRIVAVVDTGAVRRIVVHRDDQPGPIFLQRGAGDPAAPWTVDGTAPDTAVVQALLRESANLTAAGFPSDSVVYAVDFDDPAATLEVFDSEAVGAPPSVALLFVSAPDGPDILVRRADDPLVYRISAIQARLLLPLRTILLPETAE